MGDKAIISEILEASHLTDTYSQLTAQHLLGENFRLVPKKKERPEGDSVKYEGLEEEKGEGKVNFGSTLTKADEASTSRRAGKRGGGGGGRNSKGVYRGGSLASHNRNQIANDLGPFDIGSDDEGEIPMQNFQSGLNQQFERHSSPLDGYRMSGIGTDAQDEEGSIPSDDDQSGLFPLLHSSSSSKKLESSPQRGARRDGSANPQELYSSEEDLLFREDTFTVDQAVDALGFGKFQIKLSLLTGLAWMADAMEMMILSILSPALHCDWWLNSWEQAMITTVVFCGMMLSSTVWGNITDTYGRKTGLVLCSALTFYFGVLSGASPTFFWLLVLRGLVGFGIGGVPQSVTLYAEFLPSQHRAKCVVCIEAFWAIGTCFEVILAIFVMPTLGWRWLLVFSAFPLGIFLLCCLWLPESARFHVASGQTDLAYATLERVAKENGKPMLLGKLVESRGAASGPEAKRGRIVDLFVPELRNTTLLLWFIWMSNAFSYYGIVLFTTKLYESGDECHGGDATHMSSSALCPLDCIPLTHDDYKDLLWTTLAEFPGLMVTAVIIEWMGRKKTMAFEFGIFSVFVFLLFLCLNRPTVTAFIFIARAFISGCFQAAYVYTPEVYPTTTRAIGLGSCSGMARLGAILTPFVAQVASDTSVNIPIGIYGSVGILGLIAALLLPIETKGRELKDTHH